ncbi:MAG: HEPN domain-containing protein [Candidatus Omnitrophica bacterium]|nr:HEPN domain-containing protein [Candidatus Omnitrophota bacterium]MBU0896696.1 HEPN domain-containing protein [Candidatus Omnitrophota bacterium]MBU1133831.1 HEPN domain-containing protein [Candidatus Omnitrophota bacterium]MBU1810890.1 HEPN domain-containing protein [Candidatus Omnitrophota bacterium]
MNRDEVIKDLAGKWIEKADKDLLSAKRELSFSDPVTETVCFHSQQAAEKYLKSFLVCHQIYFTKTHKIVDLLELCSTIEPSFKEELEDADSLTDYAVEVRYPDAVPEPEIEDAKKAIEIAEKVKSFVSARLKF